MIMKLTCDVSESRINYTIHFGINGAKLNGIININYFCCERDSHAEHSTESAESAHVRVDNAQCRSSMTGV